MVHDLEFGEKRVKPVRLSVQRANVDEENWAFCGKVTSQGDLLVNS